MSVTTSNLRAKSRSIPQSFRGEFLPVDLDPYPAHVRRRTAPRIPGRCHVRHEDSYRVRDFRQVVDNYWLSANAHFLEDVPGIAEGFGRLTLAAYQATSVPELNEMPILVIISDLQGAAAQFPRSAEQPQEW